MKPIYSIALLSSVSVIGSVALATMSSSAPLSSQAQTSSKEVDALVRICESAGDSDARFQCLLDQGERLNRAKNLARQRGERENGGVTTIETEPSMHGPSTESPYAIATSEDGVEYTFTFRLRPRATEEYTLQSEVLVAYSESTGAWEITTISNEAIDPTSCSFSSEQQNDCL